MRRVALIAAALPVILALTACPSARPSYVPRDAFLRSQPLYFYPASGKASAIIVFYGNDVGFWESHDRLARRFANSGYSVIGVDVKRYIAKLPEAYAAREAAFRTGIDSVIRRSAHELGGDDLPLILGGHSFGANLALWTAVNAAPAHTIGVLMLSPTGRSHFYITAYDLANLGEPDEAGSFSIADLIRAAPPAMRIALLRGSHDKRISFDSTFQVAGGSRLRYTVIPFASHSLKSLTIAGPMAERAVAWILGGN